MGRTIRLGVNIDHVATLRQVRGGSTPYPDILQMAEACEKGGASLITIHLREDRRHIQESDLKILSAGLKVPLNLEMAATTGMLAMALKYRPNWACLVPEGRKELTTEGGLNVVKMRPKLKPFIRKLQEKNIRVSLFIEPSAEDVKTAFALGAQAVEFHTGSWVLAKGNKRKSHWDRLTRAANLAHHLGLAVHAGHGLDYASASEIRKLPHLQEVNIGHSLVCYALEDGLKSAVSKMRRILR